MKVLTPGHKYMLDNFENFGLPGLGQVLQFIEKGKRKDAPFTMAEGDNPEDFITYNDGTTNEEVLRVLIDRLQFLNSKFPCRENAIVITNLEESLMWLEKRTSDRQKRGVEGQPKA